MSVGTDGDGWKRLQGANDLNRLNASFRVDMMRHGFSAYAAGYLPAPAEAGSVSRDPFLLLDWPRAWLELYAREGFAASDIVVTEATRTSEPFTWTEVKRRNPGASARIFAAAADFGWHDGFAIPVHDPSGAPGETFGIVSLASPGLDGFSDGRRATVTAVALAAFGAARRLSAARTRPASRRLSPREREALSLVADGLADDQIAKFMGISRNTAHYHVENAKLRLGASSRAQAVAIALTNDLLGLALD